MADSSPQAAGGEEGVNSWERPWSIDEMKKSANDWSLAGDAGMLQYLQNFSQRIISRTHDMQEQMNGLLHESKLAEVRVHNAFNDFIMLANTQFVENRVYDEDVNAGVDQESDKKEEKEKTREEREAELIPKITTAMQLGLSVIDTAFDKLDVNDVNSDSDEDEDSPYKTEAILEPKDPYIARSLPYLIGSQAFMTDDDVGLRDAPSEGEESDAGAISESESESESEPEIEQKQPRKQSVLESEESETESESDSELFGGKDSDEQSDESDVSEEKEQRPVATQPTDFAAELAAKMGGVPPPEPVKKEKKSHESKKEKSSSKSKPKPQPDFDQDDDMFGPPPLEDEDSPFGKSGGLFSSGGGLFDDEDENQGGLFDDIVAEKPKSQKTQAKPAEPDSDTESQTEEEDEEEEEEKVKAKEPPSRARTRSGKFVPAGGVSIFGGGDEDLFGSKKDDSDSEKSQPKTETKKPAATSARGLFDDDNDDLFAAPVKKEPAKKQPPPKQQASKPTASLFDDDEEEDLFATASAATVAPASKKEEKREAPKPEKKLPAGAVSMFGSNSNPLAAAIKAQRQVSEDEESEDDWEEDEDEDKASQASSSKSGPVKPPPLSAVAAVKERSPSVSSNSLFAEEPEDDLFASKPTTAPPAKNLSKPKAPTAGGSKGLFGEDEEEEDLFTPAPKPKPPQVETKQRPKSNSLFLDDDAGEGDIFGGGVPKVTKPAEKKKPAGGVALFEDDLFGSNAEVKAKEPEKEAPKPKDEAKVEPAPARKNTTLSLFDEDPEDDIFGSSENKSTAPAKPPQTLETQHPTNKPRTRSLFADDDMLFGGAEEDPSVDLFGASSPLTPSDQSKPFPPKTEISKEPKPTTLKDKVEVKGATISASSTDLFTGDDHADIFKTSPLGPTHSTDKVDPKVEVKGATTSESSTDKSAKPTDTGKRKPVGGVSMFGGMDPTAMLKKRSGSKLADQDNEVKSQSNTDNPPRIGKDTTDLYPSSKAQTSIPPKPVVMAKPGGPPRSTSIGKLQANLGINPSALMPGAAPPVKDESSVPVGFDEPVRPNILHTVQKDRVRVQNKRRPPTRKPRGATSPNGTDITDSSPISPAAITNGPLSNPITPFTPPKPADPKPSLPTPAQQPTSTSTSTTKKGMFDEEDDVDYTSRPRTEPTVSGVRAPLRQKANSTDDLFSDPSPTNTASVPKSMSDIFSEAYSKSSASKKTKSPGGSNDDLLANAVPPPRKTQEKKVIVDITDDLFEDTVQNDTFSSSKAKSSKVGDPVIKEDKDDIFSSPSKPAMSSSSRPIHFPPSRSPPPLDNSPDDIFSDSSLLNKKVTSSEPEDNEDIFASSSLRNSKPAVPDTDDIFATATVPSPNIPSKDHIVENEEEDDLFDVKPSSSSKKKPKATTKDETLFEDNTDIFSDLPAAKKKEKKTKKKPPANDKSLFSNDIDDIFADSAVKSKPKKTSSKKGTNTSSKTDIFTDSQEGENIFDDPLNALNH